MVATPNLVGRPAYDVHNHKLGCSRRCLITCASMVRVQDAAQRLASLCQDGKEMLLRNERAAVEARAQKEARHLKESMESHAVLWQDKCRHVQPHRGVTGHCRHVGQPSCHELRHSTRVAWTCTGQLTLTVVCQGAGGGQQGAGPAAGGKGG